MSMFIYEGGGGGVKNGQNLVYVVKVCPLLYVPNKLVKLVQIDLAALDTA